MTSFGETLQVNSLQSAEYFYKYGFYSQYSTTFFSRLMFTAGLRGDYFDRINSGFTLSPRGSLSYVLNEVSSVSFSTGLYHQSPSYLWLASFKQNENLKPVKVIQYVAGYERRLTSDLRLKLEAFYKDYSDYPASLLRPYLVLANTGVGFGGSDENFGSLGLEPLISAGKGFARGLEFSLQKKSSDTPGYGILSVTYNESFFKGLDGIERAGSFDQKWIINLSGGYSFNEKWEISSRFRFATGNPYTPFNSDGSQSVVNYNAFRFEPTHSLDIRVDRRWDLGGLNLITYIDLQNIYNNKNTNTIRYDYRKGEVDKSSSIGLLPSIGVSLEF
jgi:hypothetical protein